MSNLTKESELLVFGYCHFHNVVVIPISLINLILQYFMGLLININPSKIKFIKLFTWKTEQITHESTFTVTNCVFRKKFIIGICCTDNIQPNKKIIYNTSFIGIICTNSGIAFYSGGHYKTAWQDIQVTKKDIITLEQTVDGNNRFNQFSIYINDRHLITVCGAKSNGGKCWKHSKHCICISLFDKNDSTFIGDAFKSIVNVDVIKQRDILFLS